MNLLCKPCLLAAKWCVYHMVCICMKMAKCQRQTKSFPFQVLNHVIACLWYLLGYIGTTCRDSWSVIMDVFQRFLWIVFPRKSKEQTLPLGGMESFTWIETQGNSVNLVLNFQASISFGFNLCQPKRKGIPLKINMVILTLKSTNHKKKNHLPSSSMTLGSKCEKIRGVLGGSSRLVGG